MADTKFFIILLTILAFVTIPSALIIMSYNDWNANTTQNYSKCPPNMSYCPNINTTKYSATLSGWVNASLQDLTNTTFLDIHDQIYSSSKSWIWNYGIGYISRPTKSGLLGVYYNDLLLNYVKPDSNGYYEVIYSVNNTVKKEFIIILHGKLMQDGIFLKFTNDGIRIPGMIPYTYVAEVPISNLFSRTYFNIHTRYNPTTNKVTCIVDNQYIFNEVTIPDPTLYWMSFIDSSDYYGGIGAIDDGVTLTGWQVIGGQTAPGNPQRTSFLDDVWKIVPYYKEIEKFKDAFWDLVNPFDNYGSDLTGEPIVPWFISVFIDIIFIGIIAYAITILRGN